MLRYQQESYFTYSSSEQPSPVDHDINFRPGIGLSGEETYTPRTLIYDLKGGFGSLRRTGGLYEDENTPNDDVVWYVATLLLTYSRNIAHDQAAFVSTDFSDETWSG